MLVSVCIPAYNVEKYIAQTLKSLINQSYKDIEIIIVDDGSTDNTLREISCFKDPRVHLIRSGKNGAAKSRNLAYKHSTGEYIIFFDADDVVEESYLHYQIECLKNSPSAVGIAQWGRFYGDNLSTFKLIPNPNKVNDLKSWVEEFWYKVNPMTNPGRIIIPRTVIEKAGPWNEDLSLNDDMEFFTRIFNHSSKLIFNDQSTFYYRSGVNGLSGKKTIVAYTSLYNSIELSASLVLKNYNDTTTKKACANMWQLFIYDIYPLCPELINKATSHIKVLGGSDLEFPSGGLSKVSKLLGWKLTKLIKRRLGR